MDLKKSNNYKLAPAEIVGKQRKKPRNWLNITLNILGGLFLLVILFFGAYRLWIYQSIYSMTPKDDLKFYIVLDDKALEYEESWKALFSDFIEKNTVISPILWDSLLKDNKYYLSIYQRNNEDRFNFLFYIPNLEFAAQEILKTLDIPFIYDGKFLLLNATTFPEKVNSIYNIDFNILNNVAVGEYQGEYFILSEDNAKITVNLPNIKSDNHSKLSYIDYNSLKDQLYFASNRLKWGDFIKYLNFSTNIPLSDDSFIELAIIDKEHPIFKNNFILVFKDLDTSDEILESLEYLFAYNNRKIFENILKDGSVVEEEVLDFGKFSWQDENDYKKILISEDETFYLYSTLRDGNLILASQLSDIEKIQNMNLLNLPEYYFMKSEFLSQLALDFTSVNLCENWLFKYNNYLQIESCE